MNKYINTLLFILISFTLISQESFQDKFQDGNLSMDEKKYEQALQIWKELIEMDSDNANINYKIGVCYRNMPLNKQLALPYLEKASEKISRNYDIFSPSEKNAPPEVLYYLAQSFHSNQNLDKAIATYQKFISEVPKKHVLAELAQKGIEDCKTAKELISTPIRIEIKSLGSRINSRYHEHSPVINLDETEIFFTSRRLRSDSSNKNYFDESTGKYFEDIYVSYKDDNGVWLEPELVSFSRKDGHDASVSLNPDGIHLYIYRDDVGNGSLYESKLVEDVWITPKMLSNQINNPKSFESHVSVSVDNKYLFFTSDRKGGFGGLDIYMCKKLPNGTWGLPTNLGPTINTKYDENAPFIHPDGKTLYFTSKGHKNMGGYDIYFSEWQDDGSWSEPMNMGYPINTCDDEESFITSPDGKRAYYSSYKTGGYGDGDIYMISLQEADETGLTLVKGKIMLPDNKTLPENVRIVLRDNENGDFIAESRPLKRNGSFVFIIPPGKNYKVTYEIDGKEFYEENTFVPKGTEYKEIQKEILLDPVKLESDSTEAILVKNINNAGPKWQIRFSNSKEKLSEGQVALYLSDDGSRVLYEEKIDRNGYFAYHPLGNNSEYKFKINNLEDYLLCEEGEIALIGSDEYVSYKLLPDIQCIFTKYDESTAKVLSYNKETIIPTSLVVKYIDTQGNELHKTTVDKKGNFNFHPLPKHVEYRVKLEGIEPNACKDMLILIQGKDNNRYFLESSDDDCIFKQHVPIKFKYIGDDNVLDGTLATYLNEEGTILYQEPVKNNEFKYHRLPFTKSYRIKFLENDQTICKTGEIHYIRKDGSGYKLRSAEDCIYELFDVMEPSKSNYMVAMSPGQKEAAITQVKENTPPTSKEDKKVVETPKTEKEKEQEIMDKFEKSLVQNVKSGDKISYKTNFDYNQNKININDPVFKKFVSDAYTVFKEKGIVDIAIESGASKVPTKSFSSNDELARLRAYQARDLIIDELVKKGIEKTKINTRDVTYLVQGPDYKKDPYNTRLYKPFQYVKLWVTN